MYLCYDEREESKVTEFVDKIDYNLDIIVHRRKITRIINHENLIRNEVESSDVVIVFITNNFHSCENFHKELEFAKNANKILLPVFLSNSKEMNFTSSNIIDLNDFIVTTIYEPLNSDLNEDALNRFKKFLFSALQIEERLHFRPVIDIDLISIKKMKNFESFKTSLIPNANILVIKQNDSIKILDFKISKIIGEIIIEISDYRYCWIDHLNQLFIIYNDHETLEKQGALFDQRGQLIRKINIESYISSVQYNRTNRKTYLTSVSYRQHKGLVYDENMNLESAKTVYNYPSIQISKHHIFALSYNSNEDIHIYDLAFNYLTSIQTTSTIISMHEDANREYLIYVETTSGFEILNTNTFSISNHVENPFQLLMIFNDKIIFKDSIENLFIYKINLRKAQNIIHSDFICENNSLRPHLHKNSYLLPCGHSACADCVYKNFNIYLRLYKCYVNSCKQEYRLTNELDKNLKLNEAIEKNNEKIFKTFIEYGNDFVNLKGMF